MKFKMTPSKLMIAIFAATLVAIPAVTIALPKQERSENENRTLAKFPSLVNSVKLDKAESFGEVLDSVRWDYITERQKASYMDDIETYFSDHLVGREDWVIAKNTLERLAGKQEINDVYTLDNQMIQTFKSYDADTVSGSIQAMNMLAKKHSDIPMYFMLAPTSQEIFSSQIPNYAGYLSEKTFIDECYKQLDGISSVDALSYLSGHKDEYIYYRTDHHWTSLGAYYAYCSAAKSLGYNAYDLGSFNIESASNSFRGTLFSRTLDYGVTADSIDYYFLTKNEPSVTMTAFDGSTETTYDSLYVRNYLEVKDKYSSFTGANMPVVTIETDVGNGRSLLLIKDSYAHSLVPFLSKHYSRITMVDMRYINVGLEYFVDIDDYSQVLFMYNAITFADDRHVVKLKLSK